MNGTVELKLTREEAIKRLFGENEVLLKKDVFDSYGNYKFPSDITIEQPNIAFGISYDIYDLIKK